MVGTHSAYQESQPRNRNRNHHRRILSRPFTFPGSAHVEWELIGQIVDIEIFTQPGSFFNSCRRARMKEYVGHRADDPVTAVCDHPFTESCRIAQAIPDVPEPRGAAKIEDSVGVRHVRVRSGRIAPDDSITLVGHVVGGATGLRQWIWKVEGHRRLGSSVSRAASLTTAV
jgi:hypothetical protein